MKQKLVDAVEAVSNSEIKLRKLIGEAASDGDYDAVRRLSTAAERLATVREELEGGPVIKGRNSSSVAAPKASGNSRSSRSGSAPNGYPRFERRGDVLYRIGWSKKSKREYEHKIPKTVYEQSVEALSAVADSHPGPFAAQEICERTQKIGSALPSYQVYATLALLTEAGVVERRGREGYFVSASNLTGAAEIAWAQVQEP